MKSNIKQTLIGIIIGGVFLYLTLANKPLAEIFKSIRNANLWWILASSILLLLTFYLRALRWQILLDNSDAKAKSSNVFYSVIMGYFVNSFTPKFGEIYRCTSLTSSDNIPISKSLGTVVSERVYDVLVLGLGLVFIVLYEMERLKSLLIEIFRNLTSMLTTNLNYLLGFILVAGIAMVLFIYFTRRSKLLVKIKTFIRDILATVRMSFKIKKYKSFIILTILIWITLILMNYIYLLALPETEGFSIYFAFVVLCVGGLGWALPSPGGIGTTHFFILQLFLVFGLNEQAGVSFGILSNGVTFIFTIIIGVSAIVLNKTIRNKSVSI